MNKESRISASIYIKERIERCWPYLVDLVGLGEGDWTFSWSVHRRICAERRFPNGKGPLNREKLLVEVADATRNGFQLNVQHVLRFNRASLAVFFLPLFKQKLRAFTRRLANIEPLVKAIQQSEQLASFPSAAKMSQAPDPDTQQLADRLQSLAPGTKLSELFAEALRHWPDRLVAKMCPYELAAHWGAKPADVIHLLFRAAADHVVRLNWEVFCPLCRRPSRVVGHLKHIPTTEKCPYCRDVYDVEWDKHTVAFFTPHPDMRKVELERYNTGHPATMPHILAQVQVHAGKPQSLDMSFEPGEYIVFSPQRTERYKLTVQPHHRNEAYVYFGEKFHSATIPLAPGKSRIHVELHADQHEQIEIRLEERGEEPTKLTAFEAMTKSEFHRWFPGEKLRQGTSWLVEQVTLLFCDIWHGTALYQTLGDESAMRLVEEHIDLIERETATAGGTVVKTNGDTVMCAYQTPKQGLSAALNILRKHEARKTDETVHFEIKIGLYSGPAYMYGMNGQMDFFGHTVNMAAWTHRAAARGEIVVGDVIYEQPENKRMLQRLLITAHPFLQYIPGSTVSERLYRMKIL